MSDIPTPHELARDIARLEAIVERDRDELRGDLRDGFARIEGLIAGLSFVPREVHDLAMRSLHDDMAQLRDDVTATRRQFIGGFVAVIAASAAIGTLVG
jgi:hypothetical protein